jgi:hypothetical protein
MTRLSRNCPEAIEMGRAGMLSTATFRTFSRAFGQPQRFEMRPDCTDPHNWSRNMGIEGIGSAAKLQGPPWTC